MAHKTWCQLLDPTPGTCDCGAPTDYERGYRDGLAAAKVEQAPAVAREADARELADSLRWMLTLETVPLSESGMAVVKRAQAALARYDAAPPAKQVPDVVKALASLLARICAVFENNAKVHDRCGETERAGAWRGAINVVRQEAAALQEATAKGASNGD